MPFSRMYIVNATELIPAVQKHWRTISFAAIAADAGSLVGMSKEAVKVMHQNLQSEDGFSISWTKYITPVMGPGEDLNAINRKSIDVFSADMEKLRAQGTVKVGLWQWSRRIMVESTTETIDFVLHPIPSFRKVASLRTNLYQKHRMRWNVALQ